MTKTLEEQAIDNENRTALMAAIIASGRVADEWRRDEVTAADLAKRAVLLAKAIQKEAGK